MANRKKYKKPVRKALILEEDNLFYIQNYCTIWGMSDIDFINEAIQEKINKIEKSKNDGTPIHY